MSDTLIEEIPAVTQTPPPPAAHIAESGAVQGVAWERPQRWDARFDPNMSEEIVAHLLTIKPFCDIDATRFPGHLSLRGILLNDGRMHHMKKGQIVVREGDYGNSVFLVLKGKVSVVLDKLPRRSLGRGKAESRSILRTIAKVFRRSKWPETRIHHTEREFGADKQSGVFLQDVPGVLTSHRSVDILAGELFGEIAALGRTPRVATVLVTEDDTELLELRWQGLRDVMNFAPEFNDQIEARFRENGLRSLLRGLDFMQRLPKEAMDEIVAETKFERYGNFDWYGSYEQMRQSAAAERLQAEPLIIRETEYINGLIILRGGFVRVSRAYGQGEQTISYLGKGQHYGLKEIYRSLKNKISAVEARNSLRAVGYVHILLIPSKLVEKHIIPALTPAEIQEMGLEEAPRRKASVLGGGTTDVDETIRSKLGAGVIEFFMDKRTINGSATMLINLNRCTRCDDCVRACASTHDGNPRFIRHGDRHESIQTVQACMHCHDPICMIPCPTGAIHRLESGSVVINDDTCIGCASCANNCPYDNIQMVDIRDSSGQLQYPVRMNAEGDIVRDDRGQMIPLVEEGPIRRATKCDLCYEHVGGPACARACPHDALVRMDMQETETLKAWLSR